VLTERLQFRKGDWFAIAVVLVLAVAVILCFLPVNKGSADQAEIYLNGQLVKTVDLSEDQTFALEGQYRNVIRVEDGAIAIIESDCPGLDCVHSGSIRNLGRIIVCLPNGLEIRIISAPADVDFVVG